MFNVLLQDVGAGDPGQQGGALMQFLPFILIIVVFYFFMIRPQQKRQKELSNFRDALKKGDKVVTTGGVYGKVVSVEENKVVVEVAQGVNITFDKQAIAQSADAATENKK